MLTNKLNGIKFILTMTAILIAAALLLMTSCGGGAGGGTFSGGGVSGTGKFTGSITKFGSVYVNGIEFLTGTAKFIVNDNEDATQNDLTVGMKVTVDAVDGVASSITYEPEVKGLVSNKTTGVSIDVGSFEVLGQKVIVNSETKFCDKDEREDCSFSFQALNEGDFVEVSGFFDSEGAIIATLVKKEEQDLEGYEVSGIVSNHDPDTKTFTINSLTVDYSGIVSPPVIADGDLVEVEGELVGDILIANKIELKDVVEEEGQELELEGIVTQYTSQSAFEVNGQRVQTNDQTEFNGDPASIAVDVKLKVKGTINSEGVLVASEVEIEDTDIEN